MERFYTVKISYMSQRSIEEKLMTCYATNNIDAERIAIGMLMEHEMIGKDRYLKITNTEITKIEEA